jgi:antitoxin CptB
MSDIRVKRLHFRSWHRGWKETDLILGHFADAKLGSLTPAELDLYEKLLDQDDDVIWAWIVGKQPVPVEFAALVAQLEGYGRPS